MKVQLLDVVEFYNVHPEYIGQLTVNTRYGYHDIVYADITAVDSVVHEISAGEHTVQCSPQHQLWVNTGWKFAKDIVVGDKIYCNDGKHLVTGNEVLPKRETLYDLQVADVHEFFADNFVSHNSTFVDSITFALFGKPWRKINKPQLVNSINKRDCVAEVEFITGSSYYRVVRGIKPNLFEVWVDGELQRAADLKDQQEQFEKNVLRCNHRSFCQVVVLSAASFLPFMQLPAWQRREVIEDLLDLQIFTAMNLVLKEKIARSDETRRDSNGRLRVAESSHRIVKEHLAEFKARVTVDVEEKQRRIASTRAQIESHERELSDRLKELEELTASYDMDSLLRESRELSAVRAKIESKRASINREVKFFSDHSTCSTCRQGITTEHRDSIVTARIRDAEEIERGLTLLSERETRVEERVAVQREVERDINDTKFEASTLRSKIAALSNYERELVSDFTDLKSRRSDSDETTLAALEHEIAEERALLVALDEERVLHQEAAALLKDSGIKARIVKRYVPVINTHVAKYMEAMEFMCRFELNENFEERILSRYMDEFSYESFSEGQKQRIDLALLFTWRAVAKSRNSVSTNLLVLDEVFDKSLDANGIDFVTSIVTELARECRVVVISHRDQLIDRFKDTVKFKLTHNFSEVVQS